MRVCKDCGTEIKENLSFCPNCGSKIDNNIFTFTNDKLNQIKSDAFKFSKKSKQFSEELINEIPINTNPEDFFKSSKQFIEDTRNSIFNMHSNSFNENENHELGNQMEYGAKLDYLRKNKSTTIEFAVSDEDSKEKLINLLSADVVGTGAGLIGAASTVGIIGTTLGAGLIAISALALVGSVLAKNYDNATWVESELFIWDDELVISGNFSIPYGEIKHCGVKNIHSDKLVVLTLKNQVIEFRTKNADALKKVIDEKLEEHYSK